MIPEHLYDKIATEEITTDVNGLKEFLDQQDHPVKERWVEEAVVEADELEVIPLDEAFTGTRLILKNARIHADKVIIRRK